MADELDPGAIDSAELTSDTQSVTVATISRLVDNGDRVLDKLNEMARSEGEGDKGGPRGYTITEVSRMIDRTPEAIRRAEKDGRLEAPKKRENGRRMPYSLSQINAMRDLWDLRPGLGYREGPVRMSWQNFKGGVGKSTLTCHCAQYLARAGYRVLLVDCDSQASATMTFGFRPDVDIEGDETLLPFLTDEADDLAYAIQATQWDGLDLIPSNLQLYSAEYYLAARGGPSGAGALDRLHEGLKTVELAYDIVILDPPPALGMIALSVLRSLDGLIIPTPAAMYDFHSTATFLSMLEEIYEVLEKRLGEPCELEFLKLVLSKATPERPSWGYIAALLQSSYGGSLLHNSLVQSAEIDNAASLWSTVYDLDKPTASRETYRRCIDSLDSVFGEVEELLQAVWQARASSRTLSNTGPEGQGRAAKGRPAAPELATL